MVEKKFYLMASVIGLYVTLSFVLMVHASQEAIWPFQSIYQFGDSISDTGNLIRLIHRPTLPAARLPYGETFPGRPTGRWSNGLLIIDYIAAFFGFPLLNPYLNKNAPTFNRGVNFAVAGSTALDLTFFMERGIIVPPTIASLSVQLSWFRTYLNSICSTSAECANNLRNSLIFMGEIGGNDINYPLAQGRSLQEIQTNYVPYINQAIANATREMIQAGTSRIVVPGNFPIGCYPSILNSPLRSNDSSDYDNFGCLISANNLAIFQNNNLQNGLELLRREFPNVIILYADHYNAFRSVLRQAPILGIDLRNLLQACCGVEGQYQPLGPGFCGNPGVPVCPNPNRYILWDGLHLTQKAYGRIAEIIIKELVLKFQVVK